MSTATIIVHGIPAPQGSKRHLGNGVMVEMSNKVKPWREAVKWAAIEAGVKPMAGPVRLEVVFYLPRPKSAPKSRTHADRKPDLDKLLRSTMDALSDVGVWEDDARVYEVFATKQYEKFNRPPGAVIQIAAVGALDEKGERDAKA